MFQLLELRSNCSVVRNPVKCRAGLKSLAERGLERLTRANQSVESLPNAVVLPGDEG
jgi:hypothetical protein